MWIVYMPTNRRRTDPSTTHEDSRDDKMMTVQRVLFFGIIALASTPFVAGPSMADEHRTMIDAHSDYVDELEKIEQRNGTPAEYVQASKRYRDDLRELQNQIIKAEEKENLPAMFKEPSVDHSSTATAVGDVPWESNDPEWQREVEEALRFLFDRQDALISRVEKLEQAMIRVSTQSGETVVRAVPMIQDTGYFQLAPGEKLIGFQDTSTGQWHSVGSPTVVKYSQGSPVYESSSPNVVVRTVATPLYSRPSTTSVSVSEPRQFPTPVRSTIRGAIRVTAGECSSCNKD